MTKELAEPNSTTAVRPKYSDLVVWGHDRLTIVIDVSSERASGILRITDAAVDVADPGFPADRDPAVSLVEIHTAEEGRMRSSQGTVASAVGSRLRYRNHSTAQTGEWHTLHIESHDDVTGITARTQLRSRTGVPAVQVDTTVSTSGEAVTVLAVTSIAVGAVPGVMATDRQGHTWSVAGTAQLANDPVDRLDLVDGRSEWLAEGRWSCRPVRSVLPRLDLPLHAQDGRGHYAVTSHGTWPTGEALPSGVLQDRESGAALAWQVETNGPWQWELTDHRPGVALAVLGPTDAQHQWSHLLTKHSPFTTVSASVAVTGSGGWERAIASLTDHRRALWAEHQGRPFCTDLPVVYNDFMNTLMADPTTERVLSLAAAAAAAGAEVYCIDAGWYDDGDDWWDSVGAWRPSGRRFPNGLPAVLKSIADLGLVPGLWLEPEIIGVNSSLADTLPAAAFFQRGGVRIREHGRYHLDFSHPAAVAHVDAVVDRMVDEWGVGYIKLDYNINPGTGTDRDRNEPLGAGLLAHQRGYLDWLDALRRRHSTLILESCASGAMRMDYATLLRHSLQSSSDQQDALLYPPIAASAPMSIAPEMIGNWSYPQPEMTPAEIAFTMVTGLAGRPYLSGFLDRMAPDQLALVSEALAAHRDIRAELFAAQPFWPIGLPAWDDPWIAVGYRIPTGARYLAVWHRPRPGTAMTLSVTALGSVNKLEILYPNSAVPRVEVTVIDDGLLFTGQGTPTAAFMRLH